jgi:hypothetical protein
MDQPARFKFGEGEDEWSATNPQRWDNVLQEEIAKMTEAQLFTARELVTEYLYLTGSHLTTEEACGKLRAIRRARKQLTGKSG